MADIWDGVASPLDAQTNSDPWAGVASPLSSPSGDIMKSAAAGLFNTAATAAIDPLSWMASFPRVVAQGVTRPLGAGYEYLAEKTGMPELSPGAAHFLTYPVGGDPESEGEKIKAGVLANVVKPMVHDVTGIDMNYQPQTALGRYTESGAASLPYVAQGLPPISAIGMGLGSQGGQDLAGAFTDDPRYKEAAGVIGGAAGAAGARPAFDAIANNIAEQAAQTGPRAGIWENQSSDPNAPPIVKPPSIDELSQKTDAQYQNMRDQGAAINKGGLDLIATKVSDALDADGEMNPESHKSISAWLGKFQDDAESGPMSVERLDQKRQGLLDIIKDNTSKIDGPNTQARKAQVALDALDDGVDSLEGKHTVGGQQYTQSDLAGAQSELASLQALHDDLVQGIQTNVQYNRTPWGNWRGKNITNAGDEARSLANVRQQIAEQQAHIQDIQDNIDNAPAAEAKAQQALESLNQGRALYAARARMKTIQRIQDFAYMTDNPATAMRTGFRNLAKQVKANPRGWSQEEIDGINYGAHTGLVTGALKTMGGRLISGVAGAAGGAAGGGIPGALAGLAVGETLGFPLRKAATALQARRGQAVIDQIAQRPAVQQAMGVAPPSPPRPVNYRASQPITATAIAAAAGIASNLGGRPTQAPPQPSPTPTPAAPNDQPQAAAAPLINRIAQAESGNNPNAKNPNSSASGPLQFTNDTWARSVAKWGKELGITLKDKDNPQAQTIMGQKLAEDNGKIIAKQIGRPATDGELYAAHFFGAPDVLKLIKAQGTGKQAIMLYPRRLVSENRDIFFDGNTPRTVEQVYSLLNNKVSG